MKKSRKSLLASCYLYGKHPIKNVCPVKIANRNGTKCHHPFWWLGQDLKWIFASFVFFIDLLLLFLSLSFYSFSIFLYICFIHSIASQFRLVTFIVFSLFYHLSSFSFYFSVIRRYFFYLSFRIFHFFVPLLFHILLHFIPFPSISPFYWLFSSFFLFFNYTFYVRWPFIIGVFFIVYFKYS